MSQSDDMSAIQRAIAGTSPKTDQAVALKAEFIKWYDGLSFWDKSVSDSTFQEARKRRDAFFLANATTPAEVKAVKAVAQSNGDNTRPTIQVGSHGDAVKEWQRIIGAKDDGNFGPKTKKATQLWQAQHGLVADGQVGPKTWTIALGKEILKKGGTPGKTVSGGTPGGTSSTNAKPSDTGQPETKLQKAKEKVKAAEEKFKDKTAGMPLWQKMVAGGLLVFGGAALYQAYVEGVKVHKSRKAA